MARFPDSVFKAYDIRGPVGEEGISEMLARAVGATFAGMIDEPAVAVGLDTRPSSPALAEALIEGILAAGVDVLDLGMVPTDVVYHVAGAEGVAGVMVTASHNPIDHNGFKLCRAGAAPVGESTGLRELQRRLAEPTPAATPGRRQPHDGIASYVEHLTRLVPPTSLGPLRLVLDAGHGAAAGLLEPLLDHYPFTTVGLHMGPTPGADCHPADPTRPEHLVDLTAAVTDTGAALGVAFDGDGDRAVFVDELGAPLSGSTTTALLARRMLATHPGASIAHNLVCSRAVPETIRRHGGTPIRTRVGHSFIKAVMAETGAVFAGEHSGHYYVAANHRADSGVLAMLLVAALVTESGGLASLRPEVEPYAATGEINLAVTDPVAALARVEAAFPGAEVDRLDGLSLDLGPVWANLRPSNTEALLRLNAEAIDEARLSAFVDTVRSLLHES